MSIKDINGMRVQDDLRREARSNARTLGPNIAALMIEAANTIDRLETNLMPFLTHYQSLPLEQEVRRSGS